MYWTLTLEATLAPNCKADVKSGTQASVSEGGGFCLTDVNEELAYY